MPTYIIDHKKYNKIPKYMLLWRGYGKLSAIESVEEHGYAIRLKNTNSVVYECYLPDPEYDDCCVYVDSVTMDDIIARLYHHRDFRQFLGRLGVSYSNLKEEYDMDGLLKAIWEFFDVIEFFELGDVDATDKEDVIAEITESLENEGKENTLTSKELSFYRNVDNIRVWTWFDKMLRNRGLKECPLFLWQLKITEEEYHNLKDELKIRLLSEKDENNYNREVALYFAEFHRREYGYKDNTVDDSRPSTVVFENLGFSEYETPNYSSLRARFESAMKSGAKRLNLHLYRSPENNKTYYLYSLFYNGGLPLRKVVGEDISITWHRLIRKLLESDERIEFNDEFSDLVNGVVANDSDSLKSFCQQLQDALLIEDYHLLPFCCESENDLIYQFFLNQGKSAISEIKSKNPFQIRWNFDINRHRKVIRPRFCVTGPDSISLKAEFFGENALIKEKETFSIITAEDGVEINNITYHKTNRDFYSEESFYIDSPYKDVANITIKCPELDKVLVSEELDVYSPQLIRENEEGEYQLCSNRFIGHKEVIIIVPAGWTIDNETEYNVEDDYTYLDEKAKIIILPSGTERQQVILRDETGTKKIISATVPLTKVVVMNASMVTCLRESAYFNVKNLYYSLKKSDGSLQHIRKDKLIFCSDRRKGIWTEEPSLGYIYVKPKGDDIYADPIKILNLGEDKNKFSVNYRESDSENCTIIASWNEGEIRCENGKFIGDNRWRLKKSDCEDSRYVVFECSPRNSSQSFHLTIKTRFSDFQIFDNEGKRVDNNKYISLAQLPSYKYNIQDVNLKMTIQVGMSKFECKTKGVARNSRILLSVYDCGNRREEERTILTESSLDNLLGGMSNIMKLLYSSQKDVRGATIYLSVSYNDKKFSCMIKKYPYRFVKEGLNNVVICQKGDNEDNMNEIISYEGLVKALPLYNYEGVSPIEIGSNPNGEIVLPEEVCLWKNVLLVSGKSECVLPHAVNTAVNGELSDEEKREHFRQVFIPMRNEEYPNALMWSDTWKRCCYWYETSLREHIPASSLFDLMAVMQDAKLLCRFVFNMLLKGLNSGNFTEYQEKLKRNLLDLSKNNHFLWVWIKEDDYSIMSFMPYIGESLHCYEEFLQGWYFAKMDTENLMNLLENKRPTEDQLYGFIIGFLQEYAKFMDDLRMSSLDEFIEGNTLGKNANDLLNDKTVRLLDKEEIRDAASDRLIHLSDEDEKEFIPYSVSNEAQNFTHFCERTNMFIRQMRGDENTNIFSKKSVVRRSVLYYTSTFIDPFIKVWLSGREIK